MGILPAPAAPLARAFDHTTTSYKYLFFKGLLDCCGVTGRPAAHRAIPLKHIYLRAIASAWYPHITFHLSLGQQDKIADHIRALQQALQMPSGEIPDPDELVQRMDEYRDVSKFQSIQEHLNGYVRFRFLSPWLKETLRGVPESRKNRSIEQAAQEDAKRPSEDQALPYHFSAEKGEECILVQPFFYDYLHKNASIVYDWWRWNFARYLQNRNPLCPAVVHKLEKPEKRNLNLHRMLWKERIARGGSIRCIYSGTSLQDDFDLDHFIPWSYLLHDKLWNIHPCLPEANRRKSDNLPSLEHYLDGFLDLQMESIPAIPVLTDSRARREAIRMQYELGPQLDLLQVFEKESEKARSLLKENILRLWESAGQQGYGRDWVYKSAG